MSYINTNVSSLIAVNSLNNNQMSLQTSLQRLSTGYSINSGKDNPAGLIASESLQAQEAGTQTAISNAQQANNVIGTAEGALSEVSNLLISLQSLVNSSANSGAMSSSQLNANQLQVDSILSTINRIANTTNFQGQQLLNGGLGYTTSGISTSALSNVQINAAQVPQGGSQNVVVQVLKSALTGTVTASAVAGLTSATTLSITGALGTQQVSFASSAHGSAIAAGVNQYASSTGVKAVLSGGKLYFESTGYGSSQFVTVASTSSNFHTYKGVGTGTAGTTDAGRNATLSINGALAVSNGLSVHALSGTLDMNLTLTAGFAQQSAAVKTFQITGGGATFSLGDIVDAGTLASIGIGSANTTQLGQLVDSAGNAVTLANLGSGQVAAVNGGGTTLAQTVLTSAITQVSSLRGRLGAFQANVLTSTQNSLNIALENVSSSDAVIRDTNFASETANLARSQILVQAATSVLAQANAAPQTVLKLLP